MLTPQEIQAAQQFWNWFEQNRLPFEFLESMPEAQRDDLYAKTLEVLKPYSDGVDLQPSTNIGTVGAKFQLVITTHGRIGYFEKARELAALAPAIPNWNVLALMPPLSRKVEMRYEFNGEILFPAELWFQLLETPEDPKFLGLRICLKYYGQCPEDMLDDLQQVVIQMVAHVLGEESWATNIQYLELAPLPLDLMEEADMFNLFDLPENIAEFRKERGEFEWHEQGE